MYESWNNKLSKNIYEIVNKKDYLIMIIFMLYIFYYIEDLLFNVNFFIFSTPIIYEIYNWNKAIFELNIHWKKLKEFVSIFIALIIMRVEKNSKSLLNLKLEEWIYVQRRPFY